MKRQTIFLLPLILASLVAGCLTVTDTPLNDAARKGDVEAVRKLISKGADVKAKDRYGRTPLGEAAWKGNKEVVEILIATGADVKDPTGLSRAVFYDHKDIAELLIAKGADVNARGYNLGVEGRTPLHGAAWNGNKDIVELLITKGANLSIRGDDGKTPRMLAEEQGHTEVARRLKEAEDEPRRIEVGVPDPQEEAAFAKVAQEFHDAATKPVLPEEARKFKVQAEGAVRDKMFDEAAELYGKALNIAPWWPEGHFNRAIVLGETRYYQGAMREMKRYLVLAPNAPDARAAQDKIYEWERKAVSP